MLFAAALLVAGCTQGPPRHHRAHPDHTVAYRVLRRPVHRAVDIEQHVGDVV